MSRIEDVDTREFSEIPMPLEPITVGDVALMVSLATDFESTVKRLPDARGQEYIQDHRRVTDCRKRADPGRIMLL